MLVFGGVIKIPNFWVVFRLATFSNQNPPAQDSRYSSHHQDYHIFSFGDPYLKKKSWEGGDNIWPNGIIFSPTLRIIKSQVTGWALEIHFDPCDPNTSLHPSFKRRVRPVILRGSLDFFSEIFVFPISGFPISLNLNPLPFGVKKIDPPL